MMLPSKPGCPHFLEILNIFYGLLFLVEKLLYLCLTHFILCLNEVVDLLLFAGPLFKAYLFSHTLLFLYFSFQGLDRSSPFLRLCLSPTNLVQGENEHHPVTLIQLHESVPGLFYLDEAVLVAVHRVGVKLLGQTQVRILRFLQIR